MTATSKWYWLAMGTTGAEGRAMMAPSAYFRQMFPPSRNWNPDLAPLTGIYGCVFWDLIV